MKKITLLVLYLTFSFSINGICISTDTLRVFVYGNGSGLSGYSIDGNIVEYGSCTAIPSIHIAIIDSVSCTPLNTCNINFGQYNIFNDPDGDCITDANTTYNCRARAENFFIYRAQEPTTIQHMAQLLDSMDNGHIIIAYSMYPVTYSTMDTSFRNVFQRLGSTLIPAMADTVPFIFVCRKGDASSIHEVVGLTSDDSISIIMAYQCSPTGIEEISSQSLNVYPNPAIDNFKIEFPGQGNLRMFDATGKIVFEKTDVQNNVVVSTVEFSSGIYFLELTTEGKRICKKVSVSRE